MPGRRSLLLVLLVAVFCSAGLGDGRDDEAYRNVPRGLLEREIARREAAVRLVEGGLLPAEGTGADGRRFSVQRIDRGMPQYYIEFNDTARVTVGADLVQQDGELGDGMLIGLWDGGAARTTHQEFGGRVAWSDTAVYEIEDHATHVAGTMVASGVDPRALGMAPQATVHSYDWDFDIAEMIGEASSGLLLSNHSYGYIRGWYTNFYVYWFGDTAVDAWEDYRFGFYDDYSRTVDSVACEYPDYLVVCSAGNERDDENPNESGSHVFWNEGTGAWQWTTTPREEPDGGADGFDCIPNGRAISKNTLAVAAVRDVTAYTGPGDVVMTDFSSWGPADDGRIKPDISGDGWLLFSPIGTGDAAYGTGSGTSMASPNVCGSLALVQNRYRDLKGSPMHAATLKGLAIHTAREAGPDPGPDYMFGWGLLDAWAACEVVEEDWFDDKRGRIEELTLVEGETLELRYRCLGTEDELRLTICWSDPPGTPPLPALNPPDIMLVNDLDLRVSTGASTWFPWRMNPADPAAAATRADNFRDNVEQIVIDSPGAGDYVVTISHKSTLDGGSQDVSLIATGGIRHRTWHVHEDGSGDAPDIATAVSLAGDYDSIIVHPGTYDEHDITLNKWLYLVGLEGADATTIDAGGSGRCLYLPVSTGDSVIVDGLTLTGGNIGGAAPYGGGIYCRNSLARISACVVRGNGAEDGGGIYLYEASPLIEDCAVWNNQASYRGGGIWGLTTAALIEDCLVAHNEAVYAGGGIYLMGSSWPVIGGCTVSHNMASSYGSGLYLATSSGATLVHTIVSFGLATAGIHGHPYAAGVTMTCCDVYGNAVADYSGSIPDQTGSNDNISADPLYCDAASYDFTIFDVSPCAAGASPCGVQIGWGGIGCVEAPDLIITEFVFSDTDLTAGETTSATVVVKNVGMAASDPFMIDYYYDRSTAPSPGTIGNRRYSAPALAVGDSVIQAITNISASCFGEWHSWIRVDTEDEVPELDEGNNIAGPKTIYWRIPQHDGWPVAVGGAVLGCIAVADLDDDPRDREVIAGDAAGTLHAWRADGTYVPGWPVSLADSILCSPAVGNITGDYHAEVVAGDTDGILYAYDQDGALLWSRDLAAPVYQTPALEDLDGDGRCEVIAAADGAKGGAIHVLRGADGLTWSGVWPVKVAAPRLSSPAVGDVDGDGQYEIAVCGYGLKTPVRSEIYLLRESGASFSGSWPVTIDTVIVAAPVLGDIAVTPGGPLEIVAGGINGAVYAITTGGAVWPSPPRVPGMIERSLSLMQYDLRDMQQEIVCASRYYNAPFPPSGSWVGIVTVIDNDGSIVTGWPNGAGSSASAKTMQSAVECAGSVVSGSPYGGLYAWGTKSGEDRDGFPNPVAGWLTSGAALGDVDGDGHEDIVAATSAGIVCCYDLSCSTTFPSAVPGRWSMYRCGARRTGCYYTPAVTGDEDPGPATPSVTTIRAVHPNPFNPATRIVFDLRERGRVRVAVYDAAGRVVAVIADRVYAAGRHELVWDGETGEGTQASSGVYFCRLETGGIADVRKMVLLR